MAAQSSTRLEVPERTPPKQEEPARGDRNDEKPFATYAKPKREQPEMAAESPSGGKGSAYPVRRAPHIATRLKKIDGYPEQHGRR
jgi:hypothetical protein